MLTKKLMPLALGLLMFVPALASTVMGANLDAPAIGAWEEQYAPEDENQLQAILDAPSSLDAAEARDLMISMQRGGEVTDLQVLDLFRFVRDNHDSEVAEISMAQALLQIVTDKVEDVTGTSIPLSSHWGESEFNNLIVPLTTAYLAAGLVESDMFPIPHAIQVDLYPGIGIVGCSSGFFCLRIVADLLLNLGLDMHKTTDIVGLHFALVIDFYLYCYYWWGICIPLPAISIPNIPVAADADYVVAAPAMSGSLATRATDNDVWQLIYDALGTISRLRAREFTSASPDTNTPAQGAVPGGLPGVGDVNAAWPMPTYYGLQTSAPVSVPGTPSTDPLVDSRKDDIHIRRQSEHGFAPADSTGMTAVYDMTDFRNLQLSIYAQRWKNVGTGDAGIGEPPASFYYDAPGGYVLGGSGNVHTWRFDMNDPL